MKAVYKSKLSYWSFFSFDIKEGKPLKKLKCTCDPYLTLFFETIETFQTGICTVGIICIGVPLDQPNQG